MLKERLVNSFFNERKIQNESSLTSQPPEIKTKIQPQKNNNMKNETSSH